MGKLIIFFRKMTGSMHKRINPARRFVLSFALLIIVGAFLLMLPCATRNNVKTPLLTALFTTTSATCVTGLVLHETGRYFSLFGQVVIIILIQIGGLGFMTILTMAFLQINKSINIRDRLMIAQTLSVDNLDAAVNITKHVFFATVFFEVCGAIIMSVRFIPEYGILRGIWYSIFHSISAFCNAGFDVLGNGDSLGHFYDDPVILFTISALIIIGGIGFLVWEDVYSTRNFKRLTIYSKLVIVMSVILLVFGTLFFLIFEGRNYATMGQMTPLQKWMNAFFQSVTCRTAGFDVIGQGRMCDRSKFLSIILMMVGGASGSTAGGVKVGTIAVVLLTMRASFRAHSDVVIWGRTISRNDVNNAMLLFMLWMVLVISATMLISTIDKMPFIDTMYEVTSAYGTVGLSAGVTARASVLTKLILIAYMFFGRVGIMTISVMFMTRKTKGNKITYPKGKVLIG